MSFKYSSIIGMIKTYKKYKKYSKRKTNKKKRNLYDGSKKSKVLVFTHLGLGDMFLINGAVNYLATKYDKVHLVCRNDNKNVVEDMYSDNSSIKLILVKGEADMAPWESKCQSYIKDGFDIKSGGEFSMKASKKIYDYPNSYYDDMDIDRAVRKTHFHIPKREISKQLFETFKGRPYIVVHQEFSNGKIPIVEELIKRGEKRLIINLNNNEIDKNKDPEGYIIAKSYINRKSFSDYVDLFENADEIHLIDSSVYCFALHLNLDKVKRRLVYLRPGGSVIPDSFKLFEEVYDYKDQLQYDNYHRRQLSMKGGSNTNNRKISFITYGNDAFKQSKERIVNEAKDMGCFNGKIKAYGPDDLSKEFVDKVAAVISMPRGGGYWIWKPYIIYDMLNQLNDNDILVYADSGCSLQKSAINRFNEYINMISPETEYSVLGMRLRAHNRDGSLKNISLKQKIWTTNKIFEYFHINSDSDIANKEQIIAGVIVCRKSPDSLAIFKKWLNVAEKQPDLFSDKYNEISKKQNNEFRENRHDQSIYSIILQIAPYNKSVKIINEEIEDVVNNDMFFIASRRRQGGGSRRAIKRYN